MILLYINFFTLLNEVSFSFFFLFLHVFHRQRSETQVVMQLGIDGFQLGFLHFFPCYILQVLLRLGNTDLGKWDGFTGWEGSGPLFVACYVLCSAFHLFYYFFMGFFLYPKGTHTKEEKFYSHLPGVVDCGVFHGSWRLFFSFASWLVGWVVFFFPSFFLFHSCVSGLIGFFLICLEHFSIETSTGASTLLEQWKDQCVREGRQGKERGGREGKKIILGSLFFFSFSFLCVVCVVACVFFTTL